MAGENRQPKDLTKVIGLAKTSTWAREEAYAGVREHTERVKAGEPASTFRIFPEGTPLFAMLWAQSGGGESDEDHSDVAWELSSLKRPVTARRPFLAITHGLIIHGEATDFTFRDHLMGPDAEGKLPDDIWQLQVGSSYPGRARVQELDPAGVLIRENIIGQPAAAIAGQA